MITTEADAKTRWCPFVRALHAGYKTEVMPVVNRPHAPSAFPEHCCIASGCMAWREQEQTPLDRVQVSVETVPDWEAGGYTKGAPSGDGRWWMEPPKQTLERRGFCGLAGKP